jgi:hypothetical protein
MKRNDNGDFCILYVEAGDDRETLVQTISRQKKPVVIMLGEQSRVFLRPEDFADLKHIKRQLDISMVFVIPGSERLAQIASRNGFPVYASMDALASALAVGQMARQRILARTTGPLGSPAAAPDYLMPKKTVPLFSMEDEIARRTTAPLRGSASAGPLTPPPPARKSGSLASQPLKMASPTPAPLPPQAIKTVPLPLPKKTVPLSDALPPLPPSLPPRQRARSRFPVALALLLAIALTIAGVGSLLMLTHRLSNTASGGPVLAGSITYLSSGQISENSSQGISDEVLIDLHNVPAPAQGKSYYAWLLSDSNQNDIRTILLGMLKGNNGNVRLFYPGDAQHTNLLLTTSRFLVTEEDAQVPPIAPSPDESTWRYYGEFSQAPINSPGNPKHFSYLDHLRHLLAADPTLDELELPGGLNTWLYRNTGKVLEWTGSTRDAWQNNQDITFVRRQAIRTLDYLDGISFVAQDLPPNTPLLVDERLGGVGLVQVNGPNQDPPDYLDHIVSHLNGLLQAAGSPPGLRQEASNIVTALNNVRGWLTQVRMDARQIMRMSDAQLRQPSTLALLNDMIVNATNAYVGQVDPTTGQMREGVNWIHDQMQFLATMNVTTFTNGSSHIQMISNNKHTALLMDKRYAV